MLLLLMDPCVTRMTPENPSTTLNGKGIRVTQQNVKNGKLTCETLWVAQSSSGDYHDNMNSEMFMQWVQDKLIPTFEKAYPGKKMILVADNAPYHHKRVIGSLAKIMPPICFFLREQ